MTIRPYLIMILAAFAYTNANVLHYEEQFNYVRVIAPAKSHKITCKNPR